MLTFHCDDRWTLEQNGLLEPRKSVLEDDFEEEEEKEEIEGVADASEDEKVIAVILFFFVPCFLYLSCSIMLIHTIFLLFYRIITVRVLKEKEREIEIGDVTVIDTGIFIHSSC